MQGMSVMMMVRLTAIALVVGSWTGSGGSGTDRIRWFRISFISGW